MGEGGEIGSLWLLSLNFGVLRCRSAVCRSVEMSECCVSEC